MPVSVLTSVLIMTLATAPAAAAGADMQPAVDLVTRNFGPAAAASLALTISPTACADAGLASEAAAGGSCFAISAASGGKVAIAASTMSELT